MKLFKEIFRIVICALPGTNTILLHNCDSSYRAPLLTDMTMQLIYLFYEQKLKIYLIIFFNNTLHIIENMYKENKEKEIY